MKRISLKEMLAMATVVVAGSPAYAAPAETITMTWPVGLQEVDNITSVDVEWSEAVNVDPNFTLNITNGIQGTTAHFIAGEGPSQYALIQLDEQLTEPGRYSMVIPAGVAYNGETPETSLAINEPTTLLFYIEESQGGGDGEYLYSLRSATPADGSTVGSLKHIDTYWDFPAGDEAGIGSGKVSLLNATGETLQSVELNYEWWNAEDLFFIDFEEVTAAGQYTVVIPSGIIINGNGDPANPEVILNYTINGEGGGQETAGVTLTSATPENNSTVSALDIIDTYWKAAMGGGVQTDSAHKADVTNEAGEVVSSGEIGYDWEDEDLTKIRITLSPAIATPGTYKVIIPAGAISDDNFAGANNETVLTYTVGEGTLNYDFQPIEISPKDGAYINMNENDAQSDLSSINLRFSSLPEIKAGYEFVFTNENNEEIVTAKQVVLGYGENQLILGLPSDVPSGTYTLSVPEGVIGNAAWAASGYKSGSCNEAFTVTWTYVAKEKVDLPDWVLNDPLVLETVTLTLPDGSDVNLLSNDVALAEIPARTVFNILTNKNEYANSLRLVISDNETGEILWTLATLPSKDKTIPSIGLKGDDGLFHFEKGSSLKLYNNTTYTLTVEAYENYEVDASQRINLKNAEIIFKGLTEPYKYSEVEIEDVTPEPESEINNYEKNTFTVTYSEPVNIVTEPNASGLCSGISVKYEGVYPYEEISSNADMTEWTFAIPVDQLEAAKGEVICLVMANDMEGNRVYPEYYEYNSGFEASACQMYIYSCYLGCPAVTVVPGAGVVDKLYSFEFTCPEAAKEGIGFSGMGAKDVANAYLYNAEGEIVTMMDRFDYEEEDDGALTETTVIKVTMHLEKEVTEAGEYTLYIEPGFFMTGNQYDSYTNRPQYVKYIVDPTTNVAEVLGEGVSVIAADGKITVNGTEGTVEIYAVNGAKVASETADGGQVTVALEKGVYIVTVNGKSVKVAL